MNVINHSLSITTLALKIYTHWKPNQLHLVLDSISSKKRLQDLTIFFDGINIEESSQVVEMSHTQTTVQMLTLVLSWSEQEIMSNIQLIHLISLFISKFPVITQLLKRFSEEEVVMLRNKILANQSLQELQIESKENISSLYQSVN